MTRVSACSSERARVRVKGRVRVRVKGRVRVKVKGRVRVRAVRVRLEVGLAPAARTGLIGSPHPRRAAARSRW